MTATYRLQLHAGFGFGDAAAVVPYLAELGITHLYLSPILAAAEGSTHGYDVVDPSRVSPALGGEAGFAALARTARDHGLAILLDVVPNHMSIAGTGNRWWLDVLENGPASYYAHFFDIDWSVGDDRLTLPILGERYGRELAAGHLGVVHDGAGGLSVRVRDQRLPIAPGSAGRIVRRAGERAGHAELGYIGDALADLPHERSPEARRRRHRDKAVLTRRLAELCADRRCAAAIDDEVAAVNADPSELDAVLEAQPYRLVHWTVQASQLGYRRFFDVSTLVGLHTEDLEVFEATHQRILGWLADATIAGVRVDHVDGLSDPGGYIERLRDRAPSAWIVVEKILAPGEALPPWAIDGTTGYEHAERTLGLLVDPAGEEGLTRAFTAYTGGAFDPAAARRRARHEVMGDALHSEVARLVELAARACATSPVCRDFTRAEIEHAVVELLAGYPVYRTYGGGGREAVAVAASAAAEDIDRDLLAFLAGALAFEVASPAARALAAAAQQVTSAVVAKGDEDTTGYRLVRLAARCEVGTEPGTFAAPVDRVHRELAAGRPRGLLATATHDTKRGEDVRARLAVLSEVPEAWATAVARWRARADAHWGDIAPDRVLEYLMWQTFVGAWPLDEERAAAYAIKAAREARLRTTWRKPDEAYEAAMLRWVRGVLADGELAADLARFAASIAPRGDANSLAQLLIKLAAPGVPDIYQGCELVDGTLVDPDNRRPVDFAARRDALAGLAAGSAAGVAATGDLGLAKLWTLRTVLGLRRRRADLFAGPYAPIEAIGPRADRVFAFARGESLIAAVAIRGVVDEATRLELPPGTWRDIIGEQVHRGGLVRLATLWSRFPIALLVAD